MSRKDTGASALEAFQLARLRNDALVLMERATLFGPALLRTPENHAATARGAARLARIWAWSSARRAGDADAAGRALAGAARGSLDEATETHMRYPLNADIDALAERALRLEALYAARGSTREERVLN